jgi:hypothetical protein
MGELQWYWNIPGFSFLYHFFNGWRNTPQNLRESKWEIENTLYNFRNWNNSIGHSYQFIWNRSPFRDPLAFKLDFLGKTLIKMHVEFLWFRLFYTFKDYEGRTYGFKYSSEARALILYWANGSGFNMGPEGGYIEFIYMPWEFGACALHKIIAKNDKWIDSLGYPLDEMVQKTEQFPYKYTLKDGTVQERIATVSVSRMVWRWRIFRKLKLHIGPKRDSTTIWVNFNEEIGEQVGSWKGGTTGCGYEMLPGETPEQTLRRMEKERKFN